ncbi:MAG: type I DNA topoisomerase [Bifidobacteriaceae bacterium]|nr:type I DNA topoisomerase [Bifidobacteriaceae bacterium]
MPAKKLVIVESPTKARTIGRYLGAGYQVEASVGHIRDLPQPSDLPPDMKKGPYGRFAVNVDDGFDPYYVVEPDKKKRVADLRRALKDATELYLATDEDREGEAIAWHLLQVLNPKVPVKRMVFHEITQDAIEQAVRHPRGVDTDLVDAQETRRILDRLYGYEVSPVLWRKVKAGLSAGRVQSVATRLVVERERERMAFKTAEYWGVEAKFTSEGQTFTARLVSVAGRRVATGKDFDDSGQVSATGLERLVRDNAEALAGAIEGAPFSVSELTTKPYRRRPAPPFTTSTLQQEASRKLRMNSRTTMRIAQRLYENGHITYMRTDSPNLSGQAIKAAREQAQQLYGVDSVPPAPRHYTTKTKGAQEAHEAIRPSGEHFAAPASLASALSSEELKLYQLIWMRTVASQMNDATGETVSVSLTGQTGETAVTFGAAGTVITVRGFLAAYEESHDQSRYEDADSPERRLPALVSGQVLTAQEVEAQGHQTTPPPRYSEASLVAALEKRGIGRPSTYATTVSVIEDRGYVERRGTALVPSWIAFAVTRLLEENFAELVDYDFTAAMENGLDQIAAGQEDRAEWLRQFYFGSPNRPGGLKGLVDNLSEIDARDINTIDLGNGIVLRIGRYGPYLESRADGETTGDALRIRVPDDLAPDELTPAKAQELLEAGPEQARLLGQDPVTGWDVQVKNGRFGPYVTEAPAEPPAGAKAPKARNASLFRSMSPATVTLDEALALLSLPRTVGTDPDGKLITAQNGRYGPYIRCGTDSRSLPGEDQIFTITEDEARAILAQPKQHRGRASAAPLRELGADPVSGRPVVIKDGNWGPYVTDGETNATLRKGDDPATVELARAAELLAEKRLRGPAKPRRSTSARSSAKKTTAVTGSTAKKAAASKTTASKPAASKTAAAKTTTSRASTAKAAPKAASAPIEAPPGPIEAPPEPT